VIDIIQELRSYGVEVFVTDPQATPEEAMHEYGENLLSWNDLPRADAVVAAVAHREYAELSVEDISRKIVKGGAFVDVKAAFNQAALEGAGYRVWRL
jgi:UDP-N-acetyl-D-galactosamine dehydrogenase